MFLDVLNQAILILPHLEEVVVLAELFDGAFAVRTESGLARLSQSRTVHRTCSTIQCTNPYKSDACRRALEDIVGQLICVVHPSF